MEQRHGDIADRDALQHAVEAHVLQREKGEAVDDDPEDTEDRGPLHCAADDLAARRPAGEPAFDREHRRLPITKTKVGKTRSVAVRPFHSAWFMKPHEPSPKLLLTMIMNAIVIPRATSRLRSLEPSPGFLQRQLDQIAAVQMQDVEGVEHQRVRRLMMERLKGRPPCSSSATISPSRRMLSTRRAATCRATDGYCGETGRTAIRRIADVRPVLISGRPAL
jgi:hypothetical protein